MQLLIALCFVAAAGVGAEQFYTGGLHAFLDRPPGVGASPPESQSATAQPGVLLPGR
jgi:hypothetical protein